MTIQEAYDLLRKYLGEGVRVVSDDYGYGVHLLTEDTNDNYFRIAVKGDQFKAIQTFGSEEEYISTRDPGYIIFGSGPEQGRFDSVTEFLRDHLGRTQERGVSLNGTIMELCVTVRPDRSLVETEVVFSVIWNGERFRTRGAEFVSLNPQAASLAVGFLAGVTPGGIILDWLSDTFPEAAEFFEQISGPDFKVANASYMARIGFGQPLPPRPAVDHLTEESLP